MGFPYDPLPVKPFFSCDETTFRIVDRIRLQQFMTGKEEPWLTLNVGESNVMHSKPLKVTSHDDFTIEVECETGTVKLNLDSESARKVDPAGREWIYCGGLDEANSGLGWMPVS